MTMNPWDDVDTDPDPAPTVTTSEAQRRKWCADTALFHMRLAREALIGLSANVSDLDSLIEDADEASRYYTEAEH